MDELIEFLAMYFISFLLGVVFTKIWNNEILDISKRKGTNE
ncbi:hypothetical protein [Campylobacter fetus]|nr:hypothetical protein [Campylobacter fetus]